MKLITEFELATRHPLELKILFRMASQGCADTNPEQRKQAQASLQNIQRAMRRRKGLKP